MTLRRYGTKDAAEIWGAPCRGIDRIVSTITKHDIHCGLLGKLIGKPMLFSLANRWAKFLQVDTLRKHEEAKKEF